MDREKKFLTKRHILIILSILLILMVVDGGVAYYFYNQYQASQSLLKNPNLAADKQTTQLVAQVRKLMILPTDEQPTVATVTDATKVKNQPFFKDAKNGDRILIYVNAKKAILYDPNQNVIVNVAPVNIAQTKITPSPTGYIQTAPTAIPHQVFVAPPATPIPQK
jgi:hypothetical protein